MKKAVLQNKWKKFPKTIAFPRINDYNKNCEKNTILGGKILWQ